MTPFLAAYGLWQNSLQQQQSTGFNQRKFRSDPGVCCQTVHKQLLKKWKASRLHPTVIMFQSSSILFGTTVDYRERRDQQWKTEPGCFLLGRLCLNVLLWKCVSGRTHSVANRSLFSKQSSQSVLGRAGDEYFSTVSVFPFLIHVSQWGSQKHTACPFCFRELKASCKTSQMFYLFSWCHLREALDVELN